MDGADFAAAARRFIRNLVWTVVAVNVFVVAVIGLTLYQSRIHYGATAAVQAANLSRALDEYLAGTLHEIDTTLRAVADEIERHYVGPHVDTADLNAFLERNRRRIPELDGLRVADADGTVWLGNDLPAAAPSVADREYFVRARAGSASDGLIVSKPVQSRISGTWITVFARRLKRADGSFGGMVYATVGIDKFQQVFSTLDVGPQGAVTFRHNDFTVIARYPDQFGNEGATGKTVAGPEMRALLSQGYRAGTFDTVSPFDGDMKTVAFRLLKDYPLQIVVALSATHYFGQWRSDAVRLAGLGALFLATTLWLSWATYRAWRRRMHDVELLAASAVQLQETQRIAHVGHWEWNVEAGAQHWSEESYRIFGLEPGSVPPSFELFMELVVPEDRARVQEAVRAALDADRPYHCEYRICGADGAQRHILSQAIVVRDAAGKPQRLVGTNLDISERARANEEQERVARALRFERDRNQHYLDTVQTLMVALDADGRIGMINRAGYELLGYGEEDLIGRDWFVTCLPQPEGKEVVYPMFCKIMAGELENVRYFENAVLCRDGRRRLIAWQNATMTDTDGAVVGMLSSGQDITELKQAEAHLRELSQAVEQSPEGVVITDLDARIEYVNDAFVAKTGYDRGELIGQNPRLLQSGKTPRATFEELWGALTQGQTWRGELINKRKDGSEYVAWAIIAPIRQPDGRITHYVAVKEDVTEKKRLGAELDRYRHHLEALVAQRTAELDAAKSVAEAATRAKSAFLANMSHEIRTPMNAIIGLTQLLLRSDPAPAQTARLEKIAAAGGHLLSIINDILDLSKVEAGKMTLEQTDFPLSACVDQVRSLVADAAQAKGLTIEVDYGDVPLWLRGDPTRLRQALLNYAGNAIKFTARGAIGLRCYVLEASGDEMLVRFEVKDSGIGIAADQLPGLFQAFAQADASTTRQYGGSGLGLVITQRLAALMGGEVGVVSAPGRGSTFWFTARLGRGSATGPRRPAPAAAAVEETLRQQHGAARLLLVEDDPMNQEVALAILAEAGLGADLANNGREAVAKAAATDYDLILMDMQMPQMDGLDATRAIRVLPGRAGTPILAMTANAYAADRQRCLAAGMNDFVAKPLEPEGLFAAVLKCLSPPAAAAATAEPAAASAAVPPDLAAVGLIDWDTLERQFAAKPGTVARFAALALERQAQTPAKLRAAAAAVAAGQPDELIFLAHAVKGVAANLRAAGVAAVAARCEGAARDGLEQSPALAAELAATVEGMLKELASYVKRSA